jgi:hypothetical protein
VELEFCQAYNPSEDCVCALKSNLSINTNFEPCFRSNHAQDHRYSQLYTFFVLRVRPLAGVHLRQ